MCASKILHTYACNLYDSISPDLPAEIKLEYLNRIDELGDLTFEYEHYATAIHIERLCNSFVGYGNLDFETIYELWGQSQAFRGRNPGYVSNYVVPQIWL
jgi:hypothetical protein